MRVIREVDARGRVGGASAGIDAERTDFPVGRDGANQEEGKDQGPEEQEKTEAPAAATVRFVARAGREAGWRRADDGLHEREAGWRGDGVRFRRHEAGWRCDSLWRRRWGADRRGGDDRLLRCQRANGAGIRHSRRRFRSFGLDRRARLGRGATAGQLVEPLLQLCLIGSQILWLYGTPWETAHVRPR